MSASTFLSYARGILPHIPVGHWVVMGAVSLALTVILLIRKKCPVYGAVAMGLTVFMGLFVLDAAVVIRYLGITPHTSGCNLTLDLSRLFRKTGQGPAESISNVAVFVPFGFFLAEFLASTKRLDSWRRIGWVVLAAFCLSLCIECLQLLLKVGYFEVTDLGMNTLGGLIGALMGAGVRMLSKRMKRSKSAHCLKCIN